MAPKSLNIATKDSLEELRHHADVMIIMLATNMRTRTNMITRTTTMKPGGLTPLELRLSGWQFSPSGFGFGNRSRR